MRRIGIFVLASGILVLMSASIFARQQKESSPGKASNGTPLKLVGKYDFPSSVTGRFDHLLVDLKTQRMFTTPQSQKGIMVFDLKTREVIHTIPGIEIPHHLLYRDDLNRLYVTDGGNGGALKIFDGKTYDLLKSVPLLPDTDKNRIVVIDRVARKVIATWPITLGKTAVTLALDEPHHRLFAGARSGH